MRGSTLANLRAILTVIKKAIFFLLGLVVGLTFGLILVMSDLECDCPEPPMIGIRVVVTATPLPQTATPIRLIYTPTQMVKPATEAPARTRPSLTSMPPTTTHTPAPTLTPMQPIVTHTPTPDQVVLSGSGQEVTRAVRLPATMAVLELNHSGSRNFIVKAHVGGQEELLANEIGRYHGFRPIAAQDAVTFEVRADGAWSIRIKPLTAGGRPAVSGEGDYVSATFAPPSAGAWEMRHSGTRNFIVKAHCAGGSKLVQNEIGAVVGSVFVTFSRGPCFWEIQADGTWSLQPR